jgi:ADP-ribose pyrophosphatase YjhB (NUDIX family)
MNTTLKKNTNCSYCGSRFAEQVTYPRRCYTCYSDTFSSPSPVAVVLINIWDGEKIGSLVQLRNIEPKKGEWALHGGYMENGETWEQTAAREVREELGLETFPEDYSLLTIKTAPSNGNLLVFGNLDYAVKLEKINSVFKPNDEVTAIKVAYEPMELAFPSHTEMLLKWFDDLP